MGVDYSGGMWKIRGRVAERFDPDNPTVQRRPQTGVPRDANCASCHTFLDETLEQLRARQAAEAPVDAAAATCLPPANVHVGTNGISFIRAETECIQCHNPARLDPRYAGQVVQAFAASGGWPNCNKPTNLPPRDNVPATPITNSCTIPVGHVFTPPGTVCSSCHNSVAARALQDLNPPCAQPGPNELPTLAITASLASVTEDNGTPVAQGAYTPRHFAATQWHAVERAVRCTDPRGATKPAALWATRRSAAVPSPSSTPRHRKAPWSTRCAWSKAAASAP